MRITPDSCWSHVCAWAYHRGSVGRIRFKWLSLAAPEGCYWWRWRWRRWRAGAGAGASKVCGGAVRVVGGGTLGAEDECGGCRSLLLPKLFPAAVASGRLTGVWGPRGLAGAKRSEFEVMTTPRSPQSLSPLAMLGWAWLEARSPSRFLHLSLVFSLLPLSSSSLLLLSF